jgi:hypothetical protein
MDQSSPKPSPVIDPVRILDWKTKVPDHVVFREFALETVVLNLDTGQYHGLNATGGRMLELLKQHGSVRQAAEAMAVEFPDAAETVTRDLCIFCLALSKRGLVQLVEP